MNEGDEQVTGCFGTCPCQQGVTLADVTKKLFGRKLKAEGSADRAGACLATPVSFAYLKSPSYEAKLLLALFIPYWRALIMLRASFSQCGKRLATAGSRTSFSTIARSRPAVALTQAKRDAGVSQFRSYAVAAEDTNKGVVCLFAIRDSCRAI